MVLIAMRRRMEAFRRQPTRRCHVTGVIFRTVGLRGILSAILQSVGGWNWSEFKLALIEPIWKGQDDPASPGEAMRKAWYRWSCSRWLVSVVTLLPVIAARSGRHNMGVRGPSQARQRICNHVMNSAGGSWELNIIWVGTNIPRGGIFGRDMVIRDKNFEIISLLLLKYKYLIAIYAAIL